jgi:hypothetical protein
MVRKENNIILVSPRLFLLKDKQVAQTDSAQTKGKLAEKPERVVFPSAGTEESCCVVSGTDEVCCDAATEAAGVTPWGGAVPAILVRKLPIKLSNRSPIKLSATSQASHE